MVPTAVVAEVKRLLNGGTLSYRKISETTGVSRGVVQAIASGRRPDYDELRRQRTGERLEASGPPASCPNCGHRVFLPCRGCRLQVQVDRARSLRKFRPISRPSCGAGASPEPASQAKFFVLSSAAGSSRGRLRGPAAHCLQPRSECASMVLTATHDSSRAERRKHSAYLPTPEEIARACAEIQAGWSSQERADRWQGRKRMRWEFPLVAMREVFGDGRDDGEEA